MTPMMRSRRACCTTPCGGRRCSPPARSQVVAGHARRRRAHPRRRARTGQPSGCCRRSRTARAMACSKSSALPRSPSSSRTRQRAVLAICVACCWPDRSGPAWPGAVGTLTQIKAVYAGMRGRPEQSSDLTLIIGSLRRLHATHWLLWNEKAGEVRLGPRVITWGPQPTCQPCENSAAILPDPPPGRPAPRTHPRRRPRRPLPSQTHAPTDASGPRRRTDDLQPRDSART